MNKAENMAGALTLEQRIKLVQTKEELSNLSIEEVHLRLVAMVEAQMHQQNQIKDALLSS